MIFDETPPIYDTRTQILQNLASSNRLFCTFVDSHLLDGTVARVTSQYDIIYNKVFVLDLVDREGYVITYNVEKHNVDSIPEDTILVHRKKSTNTLYTINALNELIKELNGGVLDTSFRVDWSDYRNSILLTRHGELEQLETKVHKIIQV